MTTLAHVYGRSQSVVFRKVAEEYLLVPIARSSIDMSALYVLNPTGCYIWERLDGNTPLQTILEAMVSDFAVDAAEAERDLLEFVEQLIEAGAVEEVYP